MKKGGEHHQYSYHLEISTIYILKCFPAGLFPSAQATMFIRYSCASTDSSD